MGSLQPSLQPGDRLDHFVLIRPLGEGGFGQVWLATDARLGREVAIKLPHRRLPPGTIEARRFQREAEVAAKLNHSNLIPILEAKLDNERAYIVSEYCPGPTLSEWLRERSSPVPSRLAVSIVAQLADALRVAHELGLIHRDIKPSNIVLASAETESPVPRLTDFGLARVNTENTETHVGTLIGSGPYMSPEQASGNTDEHGPHSDVHALGVVLYELLTGESPFAAVNEIDTIRRIISQDPPSVRACRPSLSRDVSAVCQHCLEKQPSRRYRNAGELRDDLYRVLAGHPPLARPVGRLGRTWRWASRNRGLAMMGVAASIGLLIGLVGLSAYAIQSQHNAALSEQQLRSLSDVLLIAEDHRSRAEEASHRAAFQRELAQKTRAESRRRSYTSDMSLAFLRLYQGHLGDVRKLLDRQIPQSGEVELRTLEWNLLDSEVDARFAVWGRHSGRGTELAVLTADDDANPANTVVSAALDGNLIFWDAATGRERYRLTGLLDQLDAIAAGPSGSIVISGVGWPLFGRSVMLIDPQTGATQEVLHAHPTTIEAIRVSADAGIIASACRYGNIRCWSAETGRSISIESGARNVAFGLSRDGARLLTSRRNPNALQLYDTRSGELIDQWKSPLLERVAMANQHSYAAYEERYRLGFGLVATDDLAKRRWIETTSHPNAMEFSADDQYLAVADCRSGVELFERVASASEADEKLAGAPPQYRSVAYASGEGGRIENVKFIGPKELATISVDGVVERFGLFQTSHEIYTIADTDSHCMIGVEGPAGTLCLSHTGELIYFAIEGEANTDAPDLKRQQVWQGDASLTSLAVTHDHETIAVTDRSGGLHLLSQWRDENGKLQLPEIRNIQLPHSRTDDDLGMASFSASGRYLAVMSNPAELFVYDFSSDAGDPILQRGYPNDQSCLAISPDEQNLFICGYAGIEMIDLSTGDSQFRLQGEDMVRTACFSPDGTRLIVGMQNGSLACLDQSAGESLFTLHSIDATGSHSDRLCSIRFLNHSKLVTIGAEGMAHFWNVEQRIQLGSFSVTPAGTKGAQCRCLHISQGGESLMVALDQGAKTNLHRWDWPAVDW